MSDTIHDKMTAIGDAIRTKTGGTELLSLDGMASAIASIPEGVTIQKKTGTITTDSSGTASASVGFKPDFVAFDFGSSSYGYNFSGAMFTEAGQTTLLVNVPPPSTSYIITTLEVTQNSSGFSVKATKVTTSYSQSDDTYRNLEYVALKYT